MNKKYYAILFLFLLIVAVASIGAFAYREYCESAIMRGQYTFMNTRNNIKGLHKIAIHTPQFGEINLYRKEGEWYFKEANNYFINSKMLACFYNMINKSMILTVNNATEKQLQNNELTNKTGTVVKTFDIEGKLLDEIIIGKHLENEQMTFARRGAKKYIYTISEVGCFSGNADSWLPYPLLNIDDNLIKDIVINGESAGNSRLLSNKKYQKELEKIMKTLQFVDYLGITYKDELQQNYPQIKPTKLEIVIVGGLIYMLDVYKIEDTYWMTVTLHTEKVARKLVAKFAKDNQKYFIDWLFHLNSAQGEVLYNAIRLINNNY